MTWQNLRLDLVRANGRPDAPTRQAYTVRLTTATSARDPRTCGEDWESTEPPSSAQLSAPSISHIPLH